jgi:HSP20 family protein
MAETSVSTRTPSTAAAGRAPDIFRSFRSEMDRLFDSFATGFGLPRFATFDADSPPAFRAPAVDVTEAGDAFKITAEMPGISEKDVQVSVSGDMLTIRGEKRQEREDKQTNAHLTERSYGMFQRSFQIPNGIDRDGISADFSNGVLTLTLPKTAELAPKQIEVKAGSST